MIGDVPGKRFGKYSPATSLRIRRGRRALFAGDVDKASRILSPLAKSENAEALYLLACVSLEGEAASSFEKRHIRQLTRAAKLGFAPAIFAIAVYLDTGEHVAKNKKRAARLFSRAAKLGHPHAQWIYAIDLLYGRNGVKQDSRLGVMFLKMSLAAKFAGAIETVASFHEKGQFDFAKDRSKARFLRRKLRGADVVSF